MSLHDLPTVNATLNGLAAVLLVWAEDLVNLIQAGIKG